MELSIEQALQQVIAAHKEGASRYRAFVSSYLAVPTEAPRCEYNLGVLAASINKLMQRCRYLRQL